MNDAFSQSVSPFRHGTCKEPRISSERRASQNERPASQSERPAFQSGRAVFQSDRPVFQSDRLAFQSDRLAFEGGRLASHPHPITRVKARSTECDLWLVKQC